MVVVSINLYDITSAFLLMHDADTVGDVKGLLNSEFGLSGSHSSLQTSYDKKKTTFGEEFSDATLLREVGSGNVLGFVLKSPSLENLKVANNFRKLMARAEMTQSIIEDGTVSITKDGIFPTSHNLKPEDLKPVAVVKFSEKDFSVLDAPTSSSSQVSSYQQKLNEMERITAEFKRVEKEHKTQLRKLLNESREELISLSLKKLSGETMTVLTRLCKTVGQCKKEDIASLVRHDAEHICLMKDNEVLKDNKRLFSYKLEPDSELDIVLKMSKEEKDEMDLNVSILFNYIDGNGLRVEMESELKGARVQLSPTNTALHLVMSINIAVMRTRFYDMNKVRMLHYLVDGTCLNGLDAFYEDKLENFHLTQDDTIITKVFMKDDRLYCLIKYGENIPSDSEEEEDDVSEVSEVENDDFTYMADYGFDFGHPEDLPTIPDLNYGVMAMGSQKLEIYTNRERNQCFRMSVLSHTPVKNIVANVADLTEIPMNAIVLLNFNTMVQLNTDALISECADSNPFQMLLQLRPALLGGGFVRKHHIKKEDALKSLTEKSMQWMNRKSDIGADSQLGAPPASLDLLLAPLNNKMREIQALQASGTKDIMKRALEKAKDDELEAIKNLLSKNKSRVRTEDKIYQICHVLNPEMEALDVAVHHIGAFKAKVLESFASLYGAEYHSEKGITVEYDNDRLLEHVQQVLSCRIALRRATSVQEAPVAEAPVEQGCFIM